MKSENQGKITKLKNVNPDVEYVECWKAIRFQSIFNTTRASFVTGFGVHN